MNSYQNSSIIEQMIAISQQYALGMKLLSQCLQMNIQIWLIVIIKKTHNLQNHTKKKKK